MKFAKALDQDRLELCDVYMARVDLLDLLVSNNCTHIPSVQQLMRPDSLRLADFYDEWYDVFSLCLHHTCSGRYFAQATERQAGGGGAVAVGH